MQPAFGVVGMARAVVVGSGPNGLAAAVTLVTAGLEVTVLETADTLGGGLRSREATMPGLVHDECSGFHPFATESVFAKAFDLRQEGLEWAWPEVQFAHPLDNGRGAHVVRSVADTALSLGPDRRAYERMYDGLTRHFEAASLEFLQPLAHVPRHPFGLARMGRTAPLSAAAVARRFDTDAARGLWAGVAAHAFRPLEAPFSAAAGLALAAAAHRFGWPVAVGGSSSIASAMTRIIERHGGTLLTGVRVTCADDLAAEFGADVVLLDTAPPAAARILGDRLSERTRRGYEQWSFGPGAFQVALAVEGGLPWEYEPARRSGVVHLGGSFEEVAAAERAVNAGTMPERPFVLLGQQYLADPSRSAGDLHPVDAYAHVPNGYTGDATEAILRQVERFAPGKRARIRAATRRSTTMIEAENANFVGGDIATGEKSPVQLLVGPRKATNPYRTGAEGAYLCSAALPPGPGAHGIVGHLAALTALEDLKL
jgi:phytoene dehydrogenase-like protein